jgi:hypothetical protein
MMHSLTTRGPKVGQAHRVEVRQQRNSGADLPNMKGLV